MNLMKWPIPKNKLEKKLYDLVSSRKLIDIDQGLMLFEEIETEENYDHTNVKLKWLEYLMNEFALKDSRYLPKITKQLKLIIENSKFDDLIVQAKILYIFCTLKKEQSFSLWDLTMSCIENHYGNLPVLLSIVLRQIFEDKGSETKRKKLLKYIYTQSKQMVLNKTCAWGTEKNFFSMAPEFLNAF
jgi:hypothetical protein